MSPDLLVFQEIIVRQDCTVPFANVDHISYCGETHGGEISVHYEALPAYMEDILLDLFLSKCKTLHTHQKRWRECGSSDVHALLLFRNVRKYMYFWR